MATIGDLALGSKVKFGSYKGNPLIWCVVHKNHPDIPENNVMLMCTRDVGVKEMLPSNEALTSSSWNLGTNHYVQKGYVHKWLNSNYTNWGGASTLTYKSEPGFLTNFTGTMQEKMFAVNVKFAPNATAGSTPCKVFPPSFKWISGSASATGNYPTQIVNETRLAYFATLSNSQIIDAFDMLNKECYCKDISYSQDYYYTYSNFHAYMKWVNNFEINSDQPGTKALYVCPLIALKPDIVVSTTQQNGYYLTEFDNVAPVISDSDRDLGDKTSSFSVPYVISDANSDTVTVKEYIDSTTIRTYTVVLGANNEFTVSASNFNSLSLGAHTLKIEADDTKTKTTRTFTFNKTNFAPVISDSDRDLGDKTSSFSLSYTVTDNNNDTVTVKEYIDTLETKSYIVTLGASNTFTISQAEFNNLSLGSHILKIEADDTKTKTTRLFTFRKQNTAPNISGSDGSIGGKSSGFQYQYSIFDDEGGTINIVEKLDNNTLNTFQSASGLQNTLQITNTKFNELALGNHVITISATDVQGLQSIRTLNFQKIDGYIRFDYKIAKKTNVMATQIMVLPSWQIPFGANVQVEACNNGFDLHPAWEDITLETRNGKYYKFVNQNKTSSEWGINIRFYVDKGFATDECIIKGFAWMLTF